MFHSQCAEPHLGLPARWWCFFSLIKLRHLPTEAKAGFPEKKLLKSRAETLGFLVIHSNWKPETAVSHCKALRVGLEVYVS